MKTTAVAVLAACTAALASACMSVPRPAPLRIELFDSRARETSPPLAASPLHLSLPEVPAADTPAAMAFSRPPARSPDSAARPDASLLDPVRPAARTFFSLAMPAVPLAMRAAAPAPAPRTPPVAPRQVSPRPAAPAGGSAVAPSGSSAVAPAPGVASAGSPAGISPAPAGTSSSPNAGSAGAYGRLREIYARQGDTLQVGLDGVGFLFLGLPDAQSDGMSFKSKENRDNRTLFTFQALKLGTYDLDFLQQDNMEGKSSRETVRVHVVSDQDFNAAVSGQPPATSEAGSADTADPLFAQKLAAVGSYQAAVAELLKGYKEGNPGLNDQIAALYLKMGSSDAAEKYYERNLTPPNDYTSRAVVGLVAVAEIQDDQQALLSRLKQFLAIHDPGAEEPLIRAVRMEKARGEIGMGLDLAAEYVTRYPAGTWRDEADFLTAQMLEADSPFRDIARARQLYSAILVDHPESAFADAARKRVLYIDRHFYEVR